jgi:hypothetical protein
MKRSLTVLLAGTMTALAVAASGAAVTSTNAAPAPEQDRASSSTKSSGPRAYGLTRNGVLVKFPLARPSDGRVVGRITGLDVDTRLVGIDFRPENGLLYGVGDQGGLYTIALRSAVATRVGQLTVPLVGQRFGVDFNPAVDALRIVSDTGQNLRHNPDPGGVTTMDTTLTTPPSTDPTTGITGVAYTNNDNSTDTGTQLYDLDTTLDQVSQQVPANSGTLSLTGKLGVDAVGQSGFDILSEIDGDRAVANQGYAVLKVNDRRWLYTVDVLSGDADRVANLGRQLRSVVDLAVVQGS